MVSNLKAKSNRSSMIRKVAVVAFALFTADVTLADFKQENFRFLEIRGNGIYSSNATGSTASGEVSWMPTYLINNDWSVRGFVGVSSFKGTTDTYLMSEYGILGGYKINPQWEVELGAGMQAGKSTSAGMGTVGVLWSLGAPVLGCIEKVFAGYSAVSFNSPTSQIKVGVALNFGANNNGVANENK